jgi:ABC-type multidrug transport system permease subunit
MYNDSFIPFTVHPDPYSVLEERSVYYRETKNGLYSTLPFVLSNTLVNMPFLFICTLLFTLISYWAIVCLFNENES